MCSHKKKIASGSDGTGQSLEALEDEITELASHIHAATCRWLGLVAEYDAREGWGHWGCRSCAHWVSWRCGIAPVAAREHVRVARRLQELPLIREAFAAGQLSYSKARALTRVEEVEREAELLELARHATAAQLERLVRAYRGVVAVERAASDEPPERWLSWSYDDHGCLLLRGRLPAEEGALVVAALEAARDAAREQAGEPGASAEAPGRKGEAVGSTSVDALGRQIAAVGSTSVDALDRQIEAVGSTSVYALDRQIEAVGSASAEMHRGVPDTMGAASAEAPDEPPPVSARALELNAGEARADALLLMAETQLANVPAVRTGGDRYQVVVHVDAATLRDSTRGEQCELDDGAPLAGETARRLACDAALVPLFERDGKPIDLGRKTRAIPPALRRALAARDRGCRFPGCGARYHVDAHHIEHWARGGPTNLANLVQLCRHHHRLLHEGGYSLTPADNGELTFRRPDGRRIVTCPAAPRGRAGAIRERRPGDRPAVIAPDACVSLSAGERLDLDLGVDALLAFAPVAAEPPGL
jgi:hypothetical protein